MIKHLSSQQQQPDISRSHHPLIRNDLYSKDRDDSDTTKERDDSDDDITKV